MGTSRLKSGTVLRKLSQALWHTFDPSTWEAKFGGSVEFKTSLIFRVSSRTVRTTQKNAVLQNQDEEEEEEEKGRRGGSGREREEKEREKN